MFKIAVFYKIKCSNSNGTISYQGFKSILPLDMKDLIEEHKPFVEGIKNMQSKFNDSRENPLFDDGNIYKVCDLNKPKKLKDKMNVLILIFDSTSFNHFRRIFPMTFKYLNNLKNNIIFKNYNVVGSNSYPNALPLFTG